MPLFSRTHSGMDRADRVGGSMADTTRIVITFTSEQRAAIDAALNYLRQPGVKVEQSTLIREAVREYLQTHYSVVLGPDAPVGGLRK